MYLRILSLQNHHVHSCWISMLWVFSSIKGAPSPLNNNWLHELALLYLWLQYVTGISNEFISVYKTLPCSLRPSEKVCLLSKSCWAMLSCAVHGRSASIDHWRSNKEARLFVCPPIDNPHSHGNSLTWIHLYRKNPWESLRKPQESTVLLKYKKP